MPSDAHAESRRKRLFAAYIRSACPGRQAQRKMDARCALILGLAERVYHSHVLLTLYILYSLFLLLSTLWLLCGSSGLRFAQTCAPCAFENAQVCDPTLSAKTKRARLGSICFGGESGIRTHGTLEAYTRFPIVLLRPARTSLH